MFLLYHADIRTQMYDRREKHLHRRSALATYLARTLAEEGLDNLDVATHSDPRVTLARLAE